MNTTTTIRRATAAVVITLIAIAAVTIGWYGLTKAWGDGHICDNGVDHAFPGEASYYAYLDTHPNAKEGSCSSTTTAPASTTSPTTSVAATTTSISGSTTSSPPDTTSASSGPSTSDDSTPTTAATVAPDTAARGPQYPVPDQDAGDECVNGRTLIHFLPCTEPAAATESPTTTPEGLLPVTGGPDPHDLLWGLGVVIVGLALVRIGMRPRRAS